MMMEGGGLTWYDWAGLPSHTVPLLEDEQSEGYLFIQVEKITTYRVLRTMASRRVTFKFPRELKSLTDSQRAVWSKLIDWHEKTVELAERVQYGHPNDSVDDWRELISQWVIGNAQMASWDSVWLVLGKPPQGGLESDKLRSSFATLRQKLDPSSDIRASTRATPTSQSSPRPSLLQEWLDTATDPRREISDQDWANAKEELRLQRGERKPDPQPVSRRGIFNTVNRLAAAYQKRLDTNRSLQGGENLAGPSQIPSGWGSAYQTQPGPSQQPLNTIGSYYAAQQRVLQMPQGFIEGIEDDE